LLKLFTELSFIVVKVFMWLVTWKSREMYTCSVYNDFLSLSDGL